MIEPMHYIRLLRKIHLHLRPDTYVEIGVAYGRSLSRVLPETDAVGIDPEPQAWTDRISCSLDLFALTSDEFFDKHDLAKELGGRPVALAFIDGMHLFEYALRDFTNLERYCASDSVVLLHDCIPRSAETSTREPATNFWTGDVWKLIVCLREYRPDLTVSVVAARPSGLGIVTGLEPSSTVLSERYDEILSRSTELDYEWLDTRRDVLGVMEPDWELVRALLPAPR